MVRAYISGTICSTCEPTQKLQHRKTNINPNRRISLLCVCVCLCSIEQRHTHTHSRDILLLGLMFVLFLYRAETHTHTQQRYSSIGIDVCFSVLQFLCGFTCTENST